MSEDDSKEAMELAEKELKELSPVAISEIGAWWKKHYAQTGHKRLARALLEEYRGYSQ